MKNCCIPIIIFLCTLFIFLNTRTAFGQQYPYRHFTVQDGLIQQQVTALHKDSRGYLWVGTKFGLSKFNGEFFENYGEKGGLNELHVTNLYEDSKGNLVIQRLYGIDIYDGKSFKQIYKSENRQNRIYSHIDTRGRLWVGHYNKKGVILLKDSLTYGVSSVCPNVEDTLVQSFGGIPQSDSVFFNYNNEIWLFDGDSCACFEKPQVKNLTFYFQHKNLLTVNYKFDKGKETELWHWNGKAFQLVNDYTTFVKNSF
ncbi:MAG: hypothetical protein GY705_28725, partial [Bacteroidetes bacterium]|nr:hypothetical protein [Bacteroidota bacterium]